MLLSKVRDCEVAENKQRLKGKMRKELELRLPKFWVWQKRVD